MTDPRPALSPCQCCRYLTLEEPGWGYEICPVCGWEDEGESDLDIDRVTGANSVSLADARDNFARFGAANPDIGLRLRPPLPCEIPRTSDSRSRDSRSR